MIWHLLLIRYWLFNYARSFYINWLFSLTPHTSYNQSSSQYCWLISFNINSFWWRIELELSLRSTIYSKDESESSKSISLLSFLVLAPLVLIMHSLYYCIYDTCRSWPSFWSGPLINPSFSSIRSIWNGYLNYGSIVLLILVLSHILIKYIPVLLYLAMSSYFHPPLSNINNIIIIGHSISHHTTIITSCIQNIYHPFSSNKISMSL